MTTNQKNKLRRLYVRGCTDSDIEDFCDRNGVNAGEAFALVARWMAPKCCKGCRHVGLFPSMYPCTSCSRPRPDLFEAAVS